MEGSQLNLQWQPNAQDVGYGRQIIQTQGDGFFHPLECEPTLQIGYVLNFLEDIFIFQFACCSLTIIRIRDNFIDFPPSFAYNFLIPHVVYDVTFNFLVLTILIIYLSIL